MGAQAQGVNRQRWQVIPRTLCFLRHSSAVLLMKRNPAAKTFPGYYNGIGGHIEAAEDPYNSALREIAEETSLLPSQLTDFALRGVVQVNLGQAKPGVMLFVFTAEAHTREVRVANIASAEGTLEWVRLDQVANLHVVEDVPIFLRRLFKPNPDLTPFFARSFYNSDDQLVVQFSPE
jgi:8-oxo-dGTP diphosphatase